MGMSFSGPWPMRRPDNFDVGVALKRAMSDERRVQQWIGWFALFDPFGLEFCFDRLRSCVQPFNFFEMHSTGLRQLRLMDVHAMENAAFTVFHFAAKLFDIIYADGVRRITPRRRVLHSGRNMLRGLSGSYMLRKRGGPLQQEQGTNHRRWFHIQDLGCFDIGDFEAMPMALQDPPSAVNLPVSRQPKTRYRTWANGSAPRCLWSIGPSGLDQSGRILTGASVGGGKRIAI
jgi:hypothetical protein